MAENNNVPIIKIVLSSPILRRTYRQAMKKIRATLFFFDEDTPALTIHNSGAYDVLITKSVGLVGDLRALGNNGYIVGLYTTGALAAEKTAYVEAGANRVVGEFLTKKVLKEILAKINAI